MLLKILKLTSKEQTFTYPYAEMIAITMKLLILRHLLLTVAIIVNENINIENVLIPARIKRSYYNFGVSSCCWGLICVS